MPADPADDASGQSAHASRAVPSVAAEGDHRAVLPPADTAPLRLFAVSGEYLQQAAVGNGLSDCLETTDPDCIVATPPQQAQVRPLLAGQTGSTLLTPGRGVRSTVSQTPDSGVSVVTPAASLTFPDGVAPPGSADTRETSNSEGWSLPAHTATLALVSDALSLEVDPYERTTTIDGIQRYLDAVPGPWRSQNTLHLSTTLRSGFETTVQTSDDRLKIVGIGNPDSHLGAAVDDTQSTATLVDLYPNGAVKTDALSLDEYGLRGLTEVGPTRAQALRDAGFRSRADISTATRSDLTSIPGIGTSTAGTISAAATAIADQRIVSTGDDTLPTGDPVFIDIETDGLNASVAWLIGILDGDAEDGQYRPFRQRHPDEPAAHLEAFMDWLTATGADRPVVAWNGYGFDFDIITDQLRDHCPEYVSAWENTYQFDPLYWASENGNAVLPGRTNKLEHVAEPLGWSPETTGVDGAAVASIYLRWQNAVDTADDPSAVAQPDWDRLEAYCEDDVRALATIYEALAETANRPPESLSTHGSETTETSQGALSDFR